MPPLLAAALALALPAATPAASGPTLAECARAFAAAPQAAESSSCFVTLAEAGAVREVLRSIDRLYRQGHAGNPWLQLTEARVRVLDNDLAGAERLNRAAATGFAAGGRTVEQAARGELTARANLWRIYAGDGRLADARREVELARRAVEAAGNPPELGARADLLEARQILREMGDLERAARLLEKASRVPSSHPYLIDLHETLGDVYLELNDLEASRQAYEKAEQLALEPPADLSRRASALYGGVRVALEKLALLPGSEAARRKVVDLAARTLEAARAAGRPDTEAYTHLILARLDGRPGDDPLGCLASGGAAAEQSLCLIARARQRAHQGRRQEARADLAAARARSAGLDLPQFQALVLSGQIEVIWMIETPERALAESWKAIAAVEELRRRQERGSSAQAGLFASWAYPYHQLAGQLFRTAGEHPQRLADGFQVLERQHARALRDAVEPAPGSAAGFAGLAEVQQLLAADEALLVFQVAPEIGWDGGFAGGSWLVAVTRSAPPRLYRLPGREELRGVLALWGEAIARRSPREPETAAAVYRQVAGRALADLPAGIRRLVVIPDDHLHRLPWGALRPHATAPPLVGKLEIALAPSATLWRDDRLRPPPPAGRAAALILAAPDLRRDLAPLPHALREGRDVRRALAGDGLLLTGERAAETALTPARVERFSVLHFATHSTVDERYPERSAVHLTAGGGRDGRLTPDEIAGLPLTGRLVVLSSCEGQAGRVLLGEGVMSLARAFFQGGARTVVASLWKVRDDDARLLSASFYRHLAAGESAAGAVAAAQRERAAAGAPAAAWAGLVVLGDGDLAPMPPRRPGWVGPLALLLAAALGVVHGSRTPHRPRE